MPTAELAHDGVLLDARGSHGDLTAHRPVTTGVHRRQETRERRQIRKVANRATDGGTPGLVLTPDVVHRLARHCDPTARFARDLDHGSRVRAGSGRLLSLFGHSSRSSCVLSGPVEGNRIELIAVTFEERPKRRDPADALLEAEDEVQ